MFHMMSGFSPLIKTQSVTALPCHRVISCPVASVAFGEQRGWGSWGSKGELGEQRGAGGAKGLGEQRGEKTLFRTINYTQLISRGHDITHL
ncbi:hypothetical protein MiSe_46330 [Microseira wollei NIES-4236]|uniref:Methylated-DNA--[protein]-cysteine S-methyltransferase n=1 Tax=Microseira wollei NIES-4236 TaxID=2530354 RepID=A0AAV3XEF6_9CYAN|nr:hypothetical protein MiSe_46330 [Microseira wollei NIES-4236]